MAFSEKQVQALRRNLDASCIRTRESNGRELSYIEGWYAISQANRIFGFDGWNRETVESRCVLARENRGSFVAVYIARVRITVQADGVTIVREGHGTGEGRGLSPGEVHDIALKAAETDATKRALATFGRPFGLELYRNGKQSTAGEHLPKKSPVREDQPKTTTALPASRSTSPSGARSDASPSDQSSPAAPPLAPSASPADISRANPPFADPSPIATSALDDTHPIARPSRHYGRSQYLATREQTGTLVREAARQATEASLVPATPEVVRTPIDKSVLTFGEPKRLRDKAHLKFVATQPCLICGRQPSDAHHLRFAQPRALGRKVSDEFTVPLCHSHHRELHQVGNEAAWWEDLEINALEISKGLWEESHSRSVISSRAAP